LFKDVRLEFMVEYSIQHLLVCSLLFIELRRRNIPVLGRNWQKSNHDNVVN
jgi:hypothetical protein